MSVGRYGTIALKHAWADGLITQDPRMWGILIDTVYGTTGTPREIPLPNIWPPTDMYICKFPVQNFSCVTVTTHFLQCAVPYDTDSAIVQVQLCIKNHCMSLTNIGLGQRS